MNRLHGGGNGSSLHFTPGNIEGTRVEMKLCELCCCPFMREVYAAHAPARECGRCIERARLRRAQE